MSNTGPSLAWWNAQLPVERRALAAVEAAVQQVSDLLPVLKGEHVVADHIRVACIESFFVNVRLTADFLALKPDSRDLRAASLLPGWEYQAAWDQLGSHWNLASKHVMHMSTLRFPDDLGEIKQITSVQVEEMADDCRDVFERFKIQYSPAD
ncbi:hypothetical protein ACFV4F_28140 [Kitasatospora sp. NPDC059722]|uniref:hypothetical protein n=1 Tax=Kitasatospora sp. NPDC059722 TaxID=3346925 RepID=UPI0036C76929